MSLRIDGTNLSVSRMFKFATALNNEEATEIGPVDTFMDGMKSLFRSVGWFVGQTKKEKLEQAYGEFRKSLNCSGVSSDNDIVKGGANSVAAFRTLALLSSAPRKFKIIKIQGKEVNSSSKKDVYKFCAGEHSIDVVAVAVESFDSQLNTHFQRRGNEYIIGSKETIKISSSMQNIMGLAPICKSHELDTANLKYELDMTNLKYALSNLKIAIEFSLIEDNGEKEKLLREIKSFLLDLKCLSRRFYEDGDLGLRESFNVLHKKIEELRG